MGYIGSIPKQDVHHIEQFLAGGVPPNCFYKNVICWKFIEATNVAYFKVMRKLSGTAVSIGTINYGQHSGGYYSLQDNGINAFNTHPEYYIIVYDKNGYSGNRGLGIIAPHVKSVQVFPQNIEITFDGVQYTDEEGIPVPPDPSLPTYYAKAVNPFGVYRDLYNLLCQDEQIRTLENVDGLIWEILFPFGF